MMAFHGTVQSISLCSYPAGYVTLRLTAKGGAALSVDVPADEARGVVVGDAYGANLAGVVDEAPALAARS